MSQEHIDESEDTDPGFLNNIAEWFHRWGKHEGCDAEQAERDAARLRSIASRLERPAVEPADFAGRMRKIADGGDQEIGHGDADRLMVEVLRSMGYDEGCDVFEAMDKWYA